MAALSLVVEMGGNNLKILFCSLLLRFTISTMMSKVNLF